MRGRDTESRYKMRTGAVSFNGGEFSPFIDARTDTEKYSSGCRHLENMIPRIYGAAERRPGTKFICSSNFDWPTLRDVPYDTSLFDAAASTANDPAKPTYTDTPLSNTHTHITKASQLMAITGNGHYILNNDIDLNGVTWTPIVDFTGVLEGNGFTISNLSLTHLADDTGHGLFQNFGSSAKVRNLKFNNCKVTARDNVGILCGKIDTKTDILIRKIYFTDCQVTATAGHYAGCLAGWITKSSVKVHTCTATDCTIVAEHQHAGGLIGNIDCPATTGKTVNVVDCTVSGGTVTSNIFCGGLIGRIEMTAATNFCNVYNCTSSMTVNFGVSYTGGLIGYGSYCTITKCSSTGAVTWLNPGNAYCAFLNQYVGGLIGYFSYSNIYTSYATGNITCIMNNATHGGDITDVGGFIGECISILAAGEKTISNCYSTGTIYLSTVVNTIETVGGFIGWGQEYLYFLNCHSTSSVTCLTTDGQILSIGGFAGSLWDNIKVLKCGSSGDITCTFDGTDTASYAHITSIGGFAGEMSISIAVSGYLTIQRCYSTSDIACLTISGTIVNIGKIWQVGGFVGTTTTSGGAGAIADGIIQDCYAWGNLTLETREYPNSTAFSYGTIYYVGGFCGYTSRIWTGAATNSLHEIENCYSLGFIFPTVPDHADTATNGIITYVGGFIGRNYDAAGTNSDTTITSCYWSAVDSGQPISDGGTEATNIELRAQSTYVDWDFTNDWYMSSGGTGKVILVPFTYSSTISYLMVLGNEFAVFLYNGALITYGEDEITYILETPYQETDLYQLKFEQIADTMWITHPSYKQRKLTRTTATTFSLDVIPFNNGPFLIRNDLDVVDGISGATMATSVATSAIYPITNVNAGNYFTIVGRGNLSSIFSVGKTFTVSGNPHPSVNKTWTVKSVTYSGSIFKITTVEDIVVTNTGGNITVELPESAVGTLTCSEDFFETGHIDALIKLVYPRTTTSSSGSKADGLSLPYTICAAIDIKGTYQLRTSGTWTATIKFQRRENSTSDDDWETIQTVIGVNDAQLDVTKTESEDNVEIRAIITAWTSGTIKATIISLNNTQEGIIRIDSIVSPTVANITVLTEVANTNPTLKWAEAAWSDKRGYPSTVVFFENRIVYAGTTNNAQTVWLSATDDYEDFEEGLIADDSFSLVIPSTNDIIWVENLEGLVVGTYGGDEWRIFPNKMDTALTPTSWTVRQQSVYGSKNIQPIKVNEAILFVDNIGRKVREFTINTGYQEKQLYSPDLSVLAEHITIGGITAIALQRNPETCLWGVLDNETHSSIMTYEREQNVVGWAKQIFGGSGVVESYAVIPTGTEDEIYVSVKRTIDGNEVRYIELIQPRTLTSLEDCWFVDSGVKYEGAATNTLTGYSHLEGETVSVLGNGVVYENILVPSGGTITLPAGVTVTKAIGGLPFTYKLQPMRLNIGTIGTGLIKRVNELAISLLNSAGVKYGDSDDNLHDIDLTSPELVNNSEIERLFTGDVTVISESGFSVEDPIIISSSSPLPCTVRAIAANFDVTGR